MKQTNYEVVREALFVKHSLHPTQTAERVAAKLSERGVAKVHPASEFGGANPADDLANDLADLTTGRAKKIDEAGPLPGEGALTGPQKTVGGDQNFTNPSYRSATRENEAAQTLKDTGYKIEQIPEGKGVSTLDYRINGHEYDCSSPFYDPATSTKTPQTAIAEMWTNLQNQKINVGKNRIVLNLDDFGVPTTDIIQHIRANPNANVQDLFILKNKQVVPYWEFLL